MTNKRLLRSKESIDDVSQANSSLNISFKTCSALIALHLFGGWISPYYLDKSWPTQSLKMREFLSDYLMYKSFLITIDSLADG